MEPIDLRQLLDDAENDINRRLAQLRADIPPYVTLHVDLDQEAEELGPRYARQYIRLDGII